LLCHLRMTIQVEPETTSRVLVPSVKRLLAIIDLQGAISGAQADLATVMQTVADRAAELTGAHGAVVEVIEGDDLVYRAATASMKHLLGQRLSRHKSLTGRCVREGRTMRSNDAKNDPRCDQEIVRRIGIGSMIVVPLSHGPDPIGVLKVTSPMPLAFSGEDAVTLELLARVIASSMRHAQAYEEVRYESLHDALTGLPNRRAFKERLTEELARHKRYKRPLSLAILDLDGFKAVNDTQGHAAGDDVLRDVAALLRRELRNTDFAFRIGGDEFAVLMPETHENDARIGVTRFVSAVLASGIAGGTVGVSAGLVEATDEDATALCRRADALMYERKRAAKRGDPSVVVVLPSAAAEAAAA
jgi:diguanylate cyclase (GGDEF)-like protein